MKNAYLLFIINLNQVKGVDGNRKEKFDTSIVSRFSISLSRLMN